MQKDTIRVWVP